MEFRLIIALLMVLIHAGCILAGTVNPDAKRNFQFAWVGAPILIGILLYSEIGLALGSAISTGEVIFTLLVASVVGGIGAYLSQRSAFAVFVTIYTFTTMVLCAALRLQLAQ